MRKRTLVTRALTVIFGRVFMGANLLALAALSCHGAEPALGPTASSGPPSAASLSASAPLPSASGSEAPPASTALPRASAEGSGRVSIGKLFENPPTWDVRGMFQQNESRFDACWADLLKTQPAERGKVSIRFIVSSEGKVTKTEEVSSTFRDPRLSSCIQKVIAGLPWPAPGGTATVVLPLVFHP